MRTFVLLSVFLLCRVVAMQAQWTTYQLSQPRSYIGGAYAEGRVFFAGGYSKVDGPREVSSAVDIYHFATGQWSVAQLSVARAQVAAAVLGNKVLFVGGYTPDAQGILDVSRVVDIYDLSTAQWRLDTLPVALGGLNAVVQSNKAYFVAGYGKHSDLVIYDQVSDAWSTVAIPGGKRKGAGLTIIGNRLLIAGGVNESGNTVDKINFYDVSTGVWSIAPYVDHEHVEAVNVGSKVFLIGTQEGGDFWVFDSSNNSLTPLFTGVGSNYTAYALLDNTMYVCGGGSSITANRNSFDAFTVNDGSIQFAFGAFFPGNVAHFRQTAVSTPIGVFMAGGETNLSATLTNNVYIWNKLTNTFSPETLQPLALLPNPATEDVWVKLPEGSDGLLQVFDLNGKCVQQETIRSAAATQRLSVQHLPAGMYQLRYRAGAQGYFGRFVKQ